MHFGTLDWLVCHRDSGAEDLVGQLKWPSLCHLAVTVGRDSRVEI